MIDQLRHPDQAADIYRALTTQAGKNPSKITSTLLEEAHALIRAKVAVYPADRFFAPDIAAARALVEDGAFLGFAADLIPSGRR